MVVDFPARAPLARLLPVTDNDISHMCQIEYLMLFAPNGTVVLYYVKSLAGRMAVGGLVDSVLVAATGA